MIYPSATELSTCRFILFLPLEKGLSSSKSSEKCIDVSTYQEKLFSLGKAAVHRRFSNWQRSDATPTCTNMREQAFRF